MTSFCQAQLPVVAEAVEQQKKMKTLIVSNELSQHLMLSCL